MFTQGLVADLILSGDSWKLGLVDIDPRLWKRPRHIPADGCGQGCGHRARGLDRPPRPPAWRRRGGRHHRGGRRRAWEADVMIPRNYGIYPACRRFCDGWRDLPSAAHDPGQRGDPRDVLRLCPKAFLVNYSNPMTAICRQSAKPRRRSGRLCIGNASRVSGAGSIHRGAGIGGLLPGGRRQPLHLDIRSALEGRDAWPLVQAQLAAERTGAQTEPAQSRGQSVLGCPCRR